ncbi:SMP-30/gluconolactonase/LRE family protein [Microbacterium sp. 179-I 3D3 NHS]|uniref:SMP-30/gluconolactonase/LRE family protein n=1 Tax=Microbacterium sp. 179-I 3D3 NHS TaxID=3142382 RepID=UPI0039A071E9
MIAVFRPERTTGPSALLGEGPVWDAARSRLLWIDILGRRLHVADPRGDHLEEIALDATPGTVMPADDGSLLIASDRGILVRRDDGTVTAINDDIAARPDLRFNDGKIDPRGRAVVGTLSLSDRPAASALYRLDEDRSLHPLLEPVSLSNGLGWSPDGRTFYYVDTPTGRVDAFDYDLDDGVLSGRRVFAEISAGLPDGLCVDDDGGVWVALWGGGAVVRHAPDGSIDARVEFTVPNVTSCAFGEGGVLFITTAAVDLDADYLAAHPEAGCLFRVDVGRTGRPATLWTTEPAGRAERPRA